MGILSAPLRASVLSEPPFRSGTSQKSNVEQWDLHPKRIMNRGLKTTDTIIRNLLGIVAAMVTILSMPVSGSETYSTGTIDIDQLTVTSGLTSSVTTDGVLFKVFYNSTRGSDAVIYCINTGGEQLVMSPAKHIGILDDLVQRNFTVVIADFENKSLTGLELERYVYPLSTNAKAATGNVGSDYFTVMPGFTVKRSYAYFTYSDVPEYIRQEVAASVGFAYHPEYGSQQAYFDLIYPVYGPPVGIISNYGSKLAGSYSPTTAPQGLSQARQDYFPTSTRFAVMAMAFKNLAVGWQTFWTDPHTGYHSGVTHGVEWYQKALARRYIRTLKGNKDVWNLDTSKICIYGHSKGGEMPGILFNKLVSSDGAEARERQGDRIVSLANEQFPEISAEIKAIAMGPGVGTWWLDSASWTNTYASENYSSILLWNDGTNRPMYEIQSRAESAGLDAVAFDVGVHQWPFSDTQYALLSEYIDRNIGGNTEIGVAPVVDAGTDKFVVMDSSIPWTPAMVSPAAWYDANDLSTITANGGAVSTVSKWTDKSGNNKDLTQGTGSSQPITDSETIGTLNAIRFDGVDDIMKSSSFEVSSLNLSVIYVMNNLQDKTWSSWGIAKNDHTQGVIRESSNGGTGFGIGHRYPESNSISFTGSYNTPYLMSYVKNGTSDQEAWLDGTSVGSRSTAITTFASEQLTIGGRIGTSNEANASVGEFIVVPNALSLENRQKIEGYLAHKWGLTDNLPADHSYKSAAPAPVGPIAVANLDGTCSKPNASIAWTKVSGLGTVVFGNASAIDTTATFSTAGTYVLRLTVDDGYNDPVSDEVVITVSDSTLYFTWSAGNFANPFTVTAMTSNSDGDVRSNMLEFAFGTDPTLTDMGSLAIDGSRNGDPVAHKPDGDTDSWFYFVRRIDHGTSGSVTCTASFSDDLASFQDSMVGLEVVATSSVNPDYQVVRVPFPVSTKFARLTVDVTP